MSSLFSLPSLFSLLTSPPSLLSHPITVPALILFTLWLIAPRASSTSTPSPQRAISTREPPLSREEGETENAASFPPLLPLLPLLLTKEAGPSLLSPPVIRSRKALGAVNETTILRLCASLSALDICSPSSPKGCRRRVAAAREMAPRLQANKEEEEEERRKAREKKRKKKKSVRFAEGPDDIQIVSRWLIPGFHVHMPITGHVRWDLRDQIFDVERWIVPHGRTELHFPRTRWVGNRSGAGPAASESELFFVGGSEDDDGDVGMVDV